MWESQIIFLSIFLVALNVGLAIGILKYKITSISLYIVALVDIILIVLLLTYFNVGGFVHEYQPFSPLNPFDVGLECLELVGFLAIFIVSLIARAKYPVIGGKGWNILLLAVLLGSVGMFFDIYGEFLNFESFFFPTYKLLTGAFQIAGIIGLTIAFLMFYKFSDILFTPTPKDS